MYWWDDAFAYWNYETQFYNQMLCLHLCVVMGQNKNTVSQNATQK